MRVIDISAPSEDSEAVAPRNTFCVYGPTGTGKTTFAGTFPRVAFLSDTTESGYESLRGFADEVLFESGVQPIVIGIEKMNDMAMAREVLAPFINSGMIKTIVKDSLTFYADLYLNALAEIHTANDNLKIYGALGRHLRDLRVRWHGMGCNVVSLCLASDPDEDHPVGLPLIPGKESGKYGASCDFLLYTQYERFKQGQQWTDNFNIHSKPYGKFAARARRALGMPDLPSPLTNVTYTSFIEALGYSAEATRAALPPYDPETPNKIAAAIKLKMSAVAAPPPAAASAPQTATRPAPNAARPAAPRHTPTAAKPHTPTAARPAARKP